MQADYDGSKDKQGIVIPATTLAGIRNVIRQIVQQFHPQKVILFGSYAYGQPTEDSDVDLLVIMPFRGSAVKKAVQIDLKVRRSFAMDLIVRTPAKVRQRVQMGDWFMREIMEKGKVLYDAAGT